MTVNRAPFRCQVCASELFTDGRLALRTRWGSVHRATELVCAQCGYVHLFRNSAIELWKPEKGYP